MSFVRPARCLLSVPKSMPSRQVSARCLHSTVRSQKNDSPVPKGLAVAAPPTAASVESSRNDRLQKRLKVAKRLKGYTAEQQEQLARQYTPAQMAAIEAGEASVDPEDIARHGALHSGPMSLKYIEDFSKIDPVLDRQPQPKVLHWDPKMRFKETEEFAEDWADFIQNLPEDADRVELQKFFDNTRMTVGKAEAELEPTDYAAPELPKLTDPIVRQQVRAMAENSASEQQSSVKPYLDLAKQTGLGVKYLRSLRIKVLVCKRVSNQTHMGKIHSMSYWCIAGDEKGLLGIGHGKAVEATQGLAQARMNAIRNMVPITRYEGRTIYGDVKGKSGATELTLFHRPPGYGIRTPHLIYEICKCAGISDLAARVTRGRNPMNTIKAALQALTSQKDPEEVARARGRKMVDLRRVYYAGNVA